MDRDIVMDVLTSVQCKVTRIDTTTGIFTCPMLLYASDGEEEDRLFQDHAQTPTNVLDAVEAQGPAIQPLEPVDPEQSERNMDIQVPRFITQRDGENPLLRDDDKVDLPEKVSTTEWIEFLMKKGPAILRADYPRNGARNSKILRKLGGEIAVLPPGDDSSDDPGDWRDKARWRRYLGALVAEMLTVQSSCSSEMVRKSPHVFVLSTFPYAALLELMAQEQLLLACTE